MNSIQANPRAQFPQTGISSNPFSIAKKFCDCIAKSFVLLIHSFIGSEKKPIEATLPPPADPTTTKTASAAQAAFYQSSSPETPSTPDRSADDFKEMIAREKAIDDMIESESRTAPVASQPAIAASPDYRLLEGLPIPEELKKNQDYINLLRTLSTAIRSKDVPKIIEIFTDIITKYPDMHSILATLENDTKWKPLLDHLHSKTKYKDILATKAPLPLPVDEEMEKEMKKKPVEREAALKQAPTSATRPPITPQESALTKAPNAEENQKKLDKAIELGKKALQVFRSNPQETESVYQNFAKACLEGGRALQTFLCDNLCRIEFWNAIDPNKPATKQLREDFEKLLAPRTVNWNFFKPEERPHTTPAPLTTSRSEADYDPGISLFENKLSTDEIGRIRAGSLIITCENYTEKGWPKQWYSLVVKDNPSKIIKDLGKLPEKAEVEELGWWEKRNAR